MAIAAEPCAIVEVTTERSKTTAGLDIGEGGNRLADPCVEISLRSAPIGLQESVRAIMRHQDGYDLHMFKGVAVTLDGRTDGPGLLCDFGKVIPRQPHSGML